MFGSCTHGMLVLAILWLNSFRHTQSAVFHEDTRLCHERCFQNGNCNGESGKCDCPYGFTGEWCEERLLPACHSTLANGSHPHHGSMYPKNCFCYLQLARISCPGDARAPGVVDFGCLQPVLRDWEARSCFVYQGVPEAAQLSDLPANTSGAPVLKWFMGIQGKRFMLTPVPARQPVLTQDTNFELRPLTECTNRCSERGWCVRAVQDPASSPVCRCPGFFEGSSCAVTQPQHCPVMCSGLGQCREGGWCHCVPGRWGHGCTRDKAYNSSGGWLPDHAQLRIYVYDLPNHVVNRLAYNDIPSLVDLMYVAEASFFDQLLLDWDVRTQNPWEANLFYMPTWSYWYSGNIVLPWQLYGHVFGHVRASYPWWNMTEGRNHVVWANGDRGVCRLDAYPEYLQNPIKLVHFGQKPRTKPVRYQYTHSTKTRVNDSSQETPRPNPYGNKRFRGFPSEFEAHELLNEQDECYRPEKDVVTPCWLGLGWWNNADRAYERLDPAPPPPPPLAYIPQAPVQQRVEPTPVPAGWKDAPLWAGPYGHGYFKHKRKERGSMLMYTGFVKPQMGYSGGVRQAIHAMFMTGPNNRTRGNTLMPNIHAQQDVAMLNATFCITPMGAGWGIRLPEAMLSGCIPIITQDHVYMPFWDVLPYPSFSIRLRRDSMHRLFDILDSITPQRVTAMQEAMAQHFRAFMWEPDHFHGGMAYNYTIASLHKRLHNLWTSLYR